MASAAGKVSRRDTAVAAVVRFGKAGLLRPCCRVALFRLLRQDGCQIYFCGRDVTCHCLEVGHSGYSAWLSWVDPAARMNACFPRPDMLSINTGCSCRVDRATDLTRNTAPVQEVDFCSVGNFVPSPCGAYVGLI